VSNHPIVHIEIPAKKAGEAGKFYGDLFGWKIEADPMYNYVQFQAEGGPGGGFAELAGSTANNPEYKPDSLIVYVGSDDIDADLAKVESLGGKTVFPKTEIPHVGWFAIFADPTGNRIALFKGVGQQG
jgi:predicted enzyme related to lactoylglutathione lyase